MAPAIANGAGAGNFLTKKFFVLAHTGAILSFGGGFFFETINKHLFSIDFSAFRVRVWHYAP